MKTATSAKAGAALFSNSFIFSTINSLKLKTNPFYSLLAVCLFSVFSCQQKPEVPVVIATVETPAPPDMSKIKAEIQAMNTAWAVAANTGDAATILAIYADDAISMPDDAPALVGKAAIQKDMEADFASSKIRKTVTYETVYVFGDENRVTETGTVIARDATGKVAYTEKYMQIWEKRKGRWQVIREIYNHDSKAR
jgi:uncharacterized protein (TIGR02246 family)